MKPTVMPLLLIFLLVCGAATAEEQSLEETFSIPAGDVERIEIREFVFTDITYSGSPDAQEFTIRFERILKDGSREMFDDLLDTIHLVTEERGDLLILRLTHPKTGIFDRSGTSVGFLHNNDWRVKMDISGPVLVDQVYECEFCDIETVNTGGELSLDTDFCAVRLASHSGALDWDADFCDIETDGLSGAFTIDLNFGVGDINTAAVTGDSRLHVSFGESTLRLPENADAEFFVTKSLASVDFHTFGSLEPSGGRSRHRVMGDGGPVIELDASFGDINVYDDQQPGRGAVSRGSGGSNGSAAVPVDMFPVADGARWEYESNGSRLTLTVENIWFEDGEQYATLAFSPQRRAPFERIEITERADGIYLTAVEGRFFGRDFGDIRFPDGIRWLPLAGDSQTGENAVTGRVSRSRRERDFTSPAGDFGTVTRYSLSGSGLEPEELWIADGVGIVGFGDFRLREYRGVESRRVRQVPPPFEEGEIQSIGIRVRNGRLLDNSEIRNLLDLREGQTYTREEIADAVGELRQKNEFIESAHFTVSREGNLRVTVYEKDIITRSLDAEASFSRVAGVGLGPTVTLKSLVGPVSEVYGGAQYHWGNEEWTYHVQAEKRFFERFPLAVGATYRLEYESPLDWAIPSEDAYLNAFLLGEETKHYHQVEGGGAYASLSWRDMFKGTVSYFHDDFTSVKKHTNWSIFHASHTKADNLPLIPGDEDLLTGMRYSLEGVFGDPWFSTRFHLAAEQSLDLGGETYRDYTRYFGDASMRWNVNRWDALVLRCAGGYSDDLLPPQRAFVLGGINTLRGFGFASLPMSDTRQFNFQYGGNRMALMNLEYHFNWMDDLGLIFFADAGNAWMKGQNADLEDVYRDVGLGVRMDDMVDGLHMPADNFGRRGESAESSLRINCAVPVGNDVGHDARWTVNFVRGF